MDCVGLLHRPTFRAPRGTVAKAISDITVVLSSLVASTPTREEEELNETPQQRVGVDRNQKSFRNLRLVRLVFGPSSGPTICANPR